MGTSNSSASDRQSIVWHAASTTNPAAHTCDEYIICTSGSLQPRWGMGPRAATVMPISALFLSFRYSSAYAIASKRQRLRRGCLASLNGYIAGATVHDAWSNCASSTKSGIFKQVDVHDDVPLYPTTYWPPKAFSPCSSSYAQYKKPYYLQM